MQSSWNPGERWRSWWMLTLNTFAFTVCFAVWMMYGVLITFLIENGIYNWDPKQMGWVIGIPVLTGALLRLPMGVATDKWGGKWVYGGLLLFSAIPTFLVSYCQNYWQFFLAGLGFGFCGTSFAVGIAYTSLWFPKNLQGTALGIFGAGNAGAALTQLGAPHVLNWLTENGQHLDNWRKLPWIYAAMLVATGILFLLTATNRIPEGSETKTLSERLRPLKHVRVWRFGLYYFFVFGGFVALAQWLVPYYVNVYATSIALAGTLAAFNTLPSGVIRAVGGWLSDLFGARAVMYSVFVISLVCCILMSVPPMTVQTPGRGVMAVQSGTVVAVNDDTIVVKAHRSGIERTYRIKSNPNNPGDDQDDPNFNEGFMVLPKVVTWQKPVVEVGQQVKRKELLAAGVTRIFFQANIWIFTALSLILGTVMGIGKAAVYKYIPEYFPKDVGVVGGIVGVLGGLGGFVCPVVFGYLLNLTGLWTSCWMFFAVLVAICLFWLHSVVQALMKQEAPHAAKAIERKSWKVLVQNVG